MRGLLAAFLLGVSSSAMACGFHDAFDVSEDWGTPVSPTYQLPFSFTGVLNKVTVEVK